MPDARHTICGAGRYKDTCRRVTLRGLGHSVDSGNGNGTLSSTMTGHNHSGWDSAAKPTPMALMVGGFHLCGQREMTKVVAAAVAAAAAAAAAEAVAAKTIMAIIAATEWARH